MPIYPVRCPNCAHRFEAITSGALRASLRCEACDHDRVEPDFDQVKIRTERRFAGSECESLREGFDPSEVAEARQLFPDTTIRDNGDVLWSKRSDIKAFNNRKAQIQREARDRQAKAAEAAG